MNWNENRIPCYMLTDDEFRELVSYKPEELLYHSGQERSWLLNLTRPTRMETMVYRTAKGAFRWQCKDCSFVWDFDERLTICPFCKSFEVYAFEYLNPPVPEKEVV